MATTASRFAIRPAVATDTEALYEICLKTADSGEDATALFSHSRLPGYIWSVPYAALEPDFAFLLTDEGVAAGYVVGTGDSAAFSCRLEAEWWPHVRQEIAGLKPARPLDAMAMDRIVNPEEHLAWLATDYPAHLHINLLPAAQSSGWGRRMIETELAALKAAGVAGVHLGVSPTNERAKGFYRHVGFEDISREGKVLFGMKFR
jgi:ribosomal protein S18 acetylase RimI-like enzyme